MHLLSIRLCDKKDTCANQWLRQKLNALRLFEYREHLFLIPDYKETVETIRRIQKEILEDKHLSMIIKNFDIVYVDEAGHYSYLDYLNPETIYIK